MSEPTPLSAEELAGYRACHRKTTGTTADAEGNLHPECICGDYWPCWPSQLLATIDAQATEIAALKGALEKTAEFLNGLAKADALPIGIADIQQEGARLDAIVLRVLAGKEAQR